MSSDHCLPSFSQRRPHLHLLLVLETPWWETVLLHFSLVPQKQFTTPAKITQEVVSDAATEIKWQRKYVSSKEVSSSCSSEKDSSRYFCVCLLVLLLSSSLFVISVPFDFFVLTSPSCCFLCCIVSFVIRLFALFTLFGLSITSSWRKPSCYSSPCVLFAHFPAFRAWHVCCLEYWLPFVVFPLDAFFSQSPQVTSWLSYEIIFLISRETHFVFLWKPHVFFTAVHSSLKRRGCKTTSETLPWDDGSNFE